jgi:membrane dipeptidase
MDDQKPQPFTLDRREFLGALSAVSGPLLLAGTPPAARQSGLPRFPYVDGLSFLADPIMEMKACGLAALVCDVSDGEMVADAGGREVYRRTYQACLKGVAGARDQIRKELPDAQVVTSRKELNDALRSKRLAVVLQMQGCDFMENDLERLQVFHELGIRVLQFTHHFGNTLAGGCMDVPQTGLTPLGIQALERMNSMGVIPDLAHASIQTGLDVLARSKGPVMVSHGACRALVDNARNTADEVIRKVADSGGVMGVFMMSFWLTREPVPKVEHLIQHLRHIIQVGGLEAVGIANDYPANGEVSLRAVGNDNAKGIEGYLPWWREMAARNVPGFEQLPTHVVIPELNNARRMFNIHAALEHARFRSAEIEKIMGGNWLRLLRQGLG